MTHATIRRGSAVESDVAGQKSRFRDRSESARQIGPRRRKPPAGEAEGEDQQSRDRYPVDNQPADRYFLAGMAPGTDAIMLRVRDDEKAGHEDHGQQSDEQNLRPLIAPANRRQSGTSFYIVTENYHS
jgi:hypothetical protein